MKAMTAEPHIASRPMDAQRIAEIHVAKVEVGGWRWDIVWQSARDGLNPGVYDIRVHVAGDFGYTRTRWGAWRAVRRAYERGAR